MLQGMGSDASGEGRTPGRPVRSARWAGALVGLVLAAPGAVAAGGGRALLVLGLLAAGLPYTSSDLTRSMASRITLSLARASSGVRVLSPQSGST